MSARTCDSSDYIHYSESPMDEDTAQLLLLHVLQIVIGCYQRGVMHPYTKDENIIFDETDKLTLIDFRCATFVNVNHGNAQLRKFEGTRTFATPEWTTAGLYYAESSTV